MTTDLTASAQLAAARDHAAAVRAQYKHLVDDHKQDPQAMGRLNLTQLEQAHDGLDADWTWGSNTPGCLPDSAEPNEAACWWDARDALAADLDHEARLIDDANGDINDSEALLNAAREVEEHRPAEGIELVLRDSTGADRAWWLQLSSD